MDSQPVIDTVAETIRGAGFRISRTPTFDEEAGEMRYFAEAINEYTGGLWQCSGDDVLHLLH